MMNKNIIVVKGGRVDEVLTNERDLDDNQPRD